jgi:hypothetical protein
VTERAAQRERALESLDGSVLGFGLMGTIYLPFSIYWAFIGLALAFAVLFSRVAVALWWRRRDRLESPLPVARIRRIAARNHGVKVD